MSSLQKDEVLYILQFKFPLLSEPITKLVAPTEAETQHLPNDITSSHSTNTKSLTNSLQPIFFFNFQLFYSTKYPLKVMQAMEIVSEHARSSMASNRLHCLGFIDSPLPCRNLVLLVLWQISHCLLSIMIIFRFSFSSMQMIWQSHGCAQM